MPRLTIFLRAFLLNTDTAQTGPRDTVQFIPDSLIYQDSTVFLGYDSLRSMSYPADREYYTAKYFHPDTLTDSLHKPMRIEDLMARSLLYPHALKKKNAESQVNSVADSDWITGLIVLCLFLFAWIQVNHRKKLKQIFKSIFATRFMNQMQREGDVLKESVSVPSYIIQLITYTFMVFGVVSVSGTTGTGRDQLKYFLIIAAAFFFGWQIKKILIRFWGKVFRKEQLAGEFILVSFILNVSAGMLLLPVMILASYHDLPLLPYAGVVFIAIVFIFRFLRIFYMGISLSGFSVIHLFLYLCTLEILPVAVLLKFVLTQ